jgi:hypothetical protein
MTLTADERERLIQQYATAPARLRAAVSAVPPEGMQWRPTPVEFSVHEIVCHCADSETNAAVRIRYLIAEKDPVIVGYDPASWASRFDYHSHPLEAALAAVDAVRANTAALLRRLPDDAWQNAGTHTESGRYTGNHWLKIYSEHLEEHIDQIGRTIDAWRASVR